MGVYKKKYFKFDLKKRKTSLRALSEHSPKLLEENVIDLIFLDETYLLHMFSGIKGSLQKSFS